MIKCVKGGHCPIGLIDCCDICLVRNKCQFVCTDSNCKVRKDREVEVSHSFYGETKENPWPLRSEK